MLKLFLIAYFLLSFFNLYIGYKTYKYNKDRKELILEIDREISYNKSREE